MSHIVMSANEMQIGQQTNNNQLFLSTSCFVVVVIIVLGGGGGGGKRVEGGRLFEAGILLIFSPN